MEPGALQQLTRDRVDSAIAPFGREALAWGPEVTLQLAPDLQAGWRLDDVEVVFDGTGFTLPHNDVSGYEEYLTSNAARFAQDGQKYMLARNPTAFSDAPRLSLEIRKTKFSVVRYYQESIATVRSNLQSHDKCDHSLSAGNATVRSRRDAFLEAAIRHGDIEFPNSLCMHAVVVTSDKRVLATKRSAKVEYSPGAWSVSVEEQLSEDDFRRGVGGLVTRWAQRLLREELALEVADCNPMNLRLMSVFLEGDALNCAVAAVLPTDLSSKELNEILEAMPRTDYEFSEWRFLTYKEVAAELKSPTSLYHPSSGYRMLLALANRYGAERVADVLFPRGHSA